MRSSKGKVQRAPRQDPAPCSAPCSVAGPNQDGKLTTTTGDPVPSDRRWPQALCPPQGSPVPSGQSAWALIAQTPPWACPPPRPWPQGSASKCCPDPSSSLPGWNQAPALHPRLLWPHPCSSLKLQAGSSAQAGFSGSLWSKHSPNLSPRKPGFICGAGGMCVRVANPSPIPPQPTC